MAEKPLASNSKKSGSTNPALMESLLTEARRENVQKQKLTNRFNRTSPSKQTDPELIENTLNQQREAARENPNQEQEEPYSGTSVEADRETSEQLRGERIGGLRTRRGTKETVPSTAKISEENETPQDQENQLAEKKQSQMGQINNLPGMKSLTGGIDPNDSPEEIAKKAVKMAAKKAIISALLWASPWIIGGLVIGLVSIVIIFVSVNVYQCYEKKGTTGLLWSTYWKGYRQTMIDAASGNCIAEDAPKPKTTETELIDEFDNLSAPSNDVFNESMPGWKVDGWSN